MNENRIILVGNGINDAQKISWSKLLNYLQEKLEDENLLKSESKINAFSSSISPTLLYEHIVKNASANDKKIRNIIKNYVEDKSNFVQKIWSLYDVVLTTNFDNNLVINKANIQENHEDIKSKKLTDHDSFLRRHLDFTYDKKQKKIFFIHGYFRQPETICLGFEQYTENLKRIENYTVERFSEKKKSKKQNKNKRINWIDYFFNDDTEIDILGLNLGPEEVDLWWILNFRAKLIQKNKINNRIRYFDLKPEADNHKLIDKQNLFSSMKIEVEKIEKASDYDSDFYSFCLKKIEKEKKIESKQ